MLEIGFVLLLAVWSAGVGLRIIAWLGQTPEHPADALALAIPLGLGVLALGTLGLGELGALNKSGLAVVAILGAWLGVRSARHAFSIPYPRSPNPYLLLVLSATLLGTLLTALAPVTDGDALCYHLQVPKVFLIRGAVLFDPDLHETVYPLLTELLYAVALACRGPVACRLVQWLLGLVFAANVTALARPSLGARAWWAGTVALLVPAVNNGMSAPLNDVSLAAFGTAALVGWTRYQDRPTPRAAAIAGLLAGLALGVKYPALVLTGLIGLAIPARPLFSWLMSLHGGLARVAPVARNRGRAATRGHGLSHSYPDIHPSRTEQVELEAHGRNLVSLRDPGCEQPGLPNFPRSSSSSDRAGATLGTSIDQAAMFCATALLVGGWWYLRAFAHTGNPVFPFFRHVFGGSGIDEVLDPIKRPMAVGIWNLMTALGPLTLHPDRFDSFSHQFGPVFLLFLPALLLERPPRRVLGIALLGYAFLTICLTQRQSMRFVLIAVGPMSLAVAWLAAAWSDRRSWPGRILVGLLLAALGFEASLAVARSRHGLRVVFGLETVNQYLDRREPTYRVARWVGEHLPLEAHLVGQDHRGFYFPRAYTMELAHRRRTGLGSRGEPAEVVVAGLRRAGFTHVLLCPPVPETAVEFDPTLGRRLAPWLAARPPLYCDSVADADGVVRRYSIHALTDDRRARR